MRADPRPWTMFEKIFYSTARHLVWGIVVAWVTYACEYGYGSKYHRDYVSTQCPLIWKYNWVEHSMKFVKSWSSKKIGPSVFAPQYLAIFTEISSEIFSWWMWSGGLMTNFLSVWLTWTFVTGWLVHIHQKKKIALVSQKIFLWFFPFNGCERGTRRVHIRYDHYIVLICQKEKISERKSIYIAAIMSRIANCTYW